MRASLLLIPTILLLFGCSGDPASDAQGASSGSTSGGAGGGGGGASSSGNGGAVPYGDNFFERAHETDANGDELSGPNKTPEILSVLLHKDHIFGCTGARGVVALSAATMRITGREDIPSGDRCDHLFASDSFLVATTRGGTETAPEGVIAVFDITSDPDVPKLVGVTLTGTTSPEGGVFLDDSTFAVAMHSDGVSLFKISAQGSLNPGKTISGFVNAQDVTQVGSTLYVADSSGVGVIDISSVANPSLQGIVATDASLKRLRLGPDGILYAAGSTDGVLAFSIADPSAPFLISSFDTPGSALDIAPVDGYVFVADWNDARVLDVSDPMNMKQVAVETLPPEVEGTFSRVLTIDASGLRSYIGEWDLIYDYELVQGQPAPDIALGVPNLVFPDGPPGGETALSLILQNEGDAPLEVTNIVGNDVFVPMTTSLSLAPGMKDYVEIRFRPTTSSPESASIVLTSNDPDEPTLVLPASGNAVGLGIGDALPAFTWVDLFTGQTVDTQALQGKVLLLSYFATF